jgi:hypothetical protein
LGHVAHLPIADDIVGLDEPGKSTWIIAFLHLVDKPIGLLALRSTFAAKVATGKIGLASESTVA